MIIDKMYITNNKLVCEGLNNYSYEFEDGNDLGLLLANLIRPNYYKNIKLTKKVMHKDNKSYSYIMVNGYESEFGFDTCNLQILVDKELISFVRGTLSINQYTKVKNKELKRKLK